MFVYFMSKASRAGTAAFATSSRVCSLLPLLRRSAAGMAPMSSRMRVGGSGCCVILTPSASEIALMINPAVVEGQVRGGTAQGIGGVLYEHAIYDENAQFLTSTFMDYLVPT